MATLMTYGGNALLVRGGALATSIACCCNCAVGIVIPIAWYFYYEDNVPVGSEADWYQPIIDEFDKLIYGFDLRAVFWVGNEEETPRFGDGQLYYDEFQVWAIVQCCPDRDCDDFSYQNYVETWTVNWDKIRDINLPQFEWEAAPTGGGGGGALNDDAGVTQIFNAAKDGLGEAGDPSSGAFVLRDSIEVCCD